ncbi:MAG TPA: type IV pilin protein [Steroidobacteraceae bacterium]|jgi:type IV pilus assembly protein PilE
MRTKGFSLVELMVALAIVAMLAAIAIPMYTKQVQHSRRVDARTAVLDAAGREERYLSTAGSYAATWAQLGFNSAAATTNALTVGSGYYQMSITSTAAVPPNTPPTYTASATPVGGSPQLQDAPCQYFSVDSTGKQFSSATGAGGADTSATCWK